MAAASITFYLVSKGQAMGIRCTSSLKIRNTFCCSLVLIETGQRRNTVPTLKTLTRRSLQRRLISTSIEWMIGKDIEIVFEGIEISVVVTVRFVISKSSMLL
jgi:hypothetical protein